MDLTQVTLFVMKGGGELIKEVNPSRRKDYVKGKEERNSDAEGLKMCKSFEFSIAF